MTSTHVEEDTQRNKNVSSALKIKVGPERYRYVSNVSRTM